MNRSNSEVCINERFIAPDESVDDTDARNIVIVYNPADGVSGKAYCFTVDDIKGLTQKIFVGADKLVDVLKNPYTGLLMSAGVLANIKKGWNTILITGTHSFWSGLKDSGKNVTILNGKPIHRDTFLYGTIDDMKAENVGLAPPAGADLLDLRLFNSRAEDREEDNEEDMRVALETASRLRALNAKRVLKSE